MNNKNIINSYDWRVHLDLLDDTDDGSVPFYTDELQKEIDNSILQSIQIAALKSCGWTEVYFGENWFNISDEWCEQSLTGQYSCMGHTWYFENKEDAAWAILKWK